MDASVPMDGLDYVTCLLPQQGDVRGESKGVARENVPQTFPHSAWQPAGAAFALAVTVANRHSARTRGGVPWDGGWTVQYSNQF